MINEHFVTGRLRVAPLLCVLCVRDSAARQGLNSGSCVPGHTKTPKSYFTAREDE